MNLQNKKKWSLYCSYYANKTLMSSPSSVWSKSIDLYTAKYHHLLFLRDFSAGVEDTYLKNFCRNYNLTSMVKKPTFHKNPEKPSSIDLI